MRRNACLIGNRIWRPPTKENKFPVEAVSHGLLARLSQYDRCTAEVAATLTPQRLNSGFGKLPAVKVTFPHTEDSSLEP